MRMPRVATLLVLWAALWLGDSGPRGLGASELTPQNGSTRHGRGEPTAHAQSGSTTQSTPPLQAPAPQSPTFRTTVDVVAVDVNVIDSSGRPVSDLTAVDFSLRVDGRPRRVRSAEFVSLVRTGDSPEETSTPGTNSGRTTGRLIMLVIDQANIRKGTGKEAFRAASRFIDGLNRSDRLALQIIPGVGPVSEFTANHNLVKDVLERTVGQGIEADRSGRVGQSEAIAVAEANDENACQGILERECMGFHDTASLADCRQRLVGEVRDVYTQTLANTRMSLMSLRGIIDRLALTSEPKTVVLISEGLIVDQRMSDLSWIEPQTAAAHVSLFGIRLSAPHYTAIMGRTSPTREADQFLLAQGMDEIVGRGRGSVYPMGVNADVSFRRLGLELSGYYLLTFEPAPSDRDGESHDIDIRVARRGTTVRAPRTFSAAPAGSARATSDVLVETLRSALTAADFPLSVSTFAYRDDQTNRLKVILGVEIDRRFNPSGPLALGYYVTDSKGSLAWADTEKALVPAAGEVGTSQRYMSAVVLDPGAYTVKVAVVDERGLRASVDAAFVARLSSFGQVRVGELMLARPGLDGGRMRPVIDGMVDSDGLVAYTELYSEAEVQLRNASLRVEIASSADGRVIESSDMSFAPGREGRRAAQGTVGVGLLPPGDYVARAVLLSSGRDVGRVVRPFRIVRATPEPGRAVRPSAADLAPTVAPAPESRRLIEASIARFDRLAVLARPVTGFFIDRMVVAGVPPIPESLVPAVGLARMGQFSDVLRVVETANTDHVVGSFLAGLADFAQGRLDDAAAKFTRVLKQAPAFAPATFYLGACYATAGQDREAAFVWRSAVIKDRAAPWIFTALADAFMRIGEHEHALPLLQEALGEWPADDTVLVRWATALALTGRGDAAVLALEPYLARQPNDPDRLLMAMRLIYEARLGGRFVEGQAADRARFSRYFDAYGKTSGTERTLAEQWKRIVDR